MGNSWSASPSFTSEITIEDDEPPDKPPGCDHVLKVKFLETKNFNLTAVGKMQTLIRVSTSFSPTQSYTKPVKCCSKDGQTEWFLPTKRFIFYSADPTGEVKVSLLQNIVPPLPAVPNLKTETVSLSQDRKNRKAATLAKLVIPVSHEEFKVQKHVERWYTVDVPTEGEAPQVLIAFDYVYKPPCAGVVKTGQNISDKYDVDAVLGSGQSVVKKAVNKVTKKEVAVKFLSKSIKGQKKPQNCFDQEIDLLRSLSHPNIVELVETMENPETMYIVMELVKGADLFEITEALGCLPPGVAGSVLHQVLSAIAYMHSRGFVHHDLKPENVVMDFKENKVKLTDFGSARDVKHMSGIAGTINYMAPEVLMNMRGAEKQVDQSVDIWSIGVMAYVILCGYNPFDYKCKANQNIITRIVNGKFDFPSPQWDNIPKVCKDFIRRCLVVDPKKRPSASELLKHPWMVASCNPSAPGNSLSQSDRHRLEGHRSRNASRSNSLRSLMELFGSGSPIVVRS